MLKLGRGGGTCTTTSFPIAMQKQDQAGDLRPLRGGVAQDTRLVRRRADKAGRRVKIQCFLRTVGSFLGQVTYIYNELIDQL